MGRHAAGEAPEVDRIVDDACAGIGSEVSALRLPGLAGVVLGGGYGRGEGGVTPALALSNDLDFFAITIEGAPEAETVAAIGSALKPISEKWTARLGIDVDFTVRTPWRIRHDQERIMIQELVRGHFDVAGTGGAELFADVARIDAERLPWMEAARLLMNRGMGLLFANSDLQFNADFVNRNINKCILGAGDARLVAHHAYRWRATERAAALGDGLYSRAVEWKFRPSAEPVCSWEAARDAWLAAFREVDAASGGAGARRSLRNAARWIVRRRTVGDIRTFARDPVARVLAGVSKCIRDRRAPCSGLVRDWEVFN